MSNEGRKQSIAQMRPPRPRGCGDLGRFLMLADLALRFGKVRRATLHEDGEAESDTTHTIMLALAAMEAAPRIGCDPGLAVQFAMVHDLPEVHAGDTVTAHGLSAEEAEAKAQREEAAVQRLSIEIEGSPVLLLLRRYEAQREPEARMVRYLDKILPKLTHYLNGGLALEAIGLTEAAVLEKHASQGALMAAEYPEMPEVGRLFAESCELVEQGIKAGVVRTAAEAVATRHDGAMTRDPETLHMFLIGDMECVIASSVGDAWAVWEENTGCERGETFDDVNDACTEIADDRLLACSVDASGEPCELGEGSVRKQTAAEWARQLGRCLAFSHE